MERRIICLLTLGFILVISGCASKLSVEQFPTGDVTGNGIVVHTPVAHLLTKKIEIFDKDKKLCQASIKRETINLPSKGAYTVNVDPALFASNTFSIEFNDQALLKKVHLESDPQIDETLEASASLIKEVSGLAAQIAPAAMGVPFAPSQLQNRTDVDVATCGKFMRETILCLNPIETGGPVGCAVSDDQMGNS